MPKLILNDIASGFATTALINSNNTAIEDAVEKTLSRDGTAPNQMEAPLDMNGNMILNQANPITVAGFNWEGPWVTATTYQIGDVVEHLNSSYIAIVEHTSGVFADDLAASKWQIVASSAALPSQAGHAGDLLSTDGSNSAWVDVNSVALPITGGTLTGDLQGTTATFSGNVSLNGTPTAPTAAVSTDTTQIATTAFVLGQASDSLPLVDASSASAGSSELYSRANHVHPQRNIATLVGSTLSGTGVTLSTSIPSWANKITLVFFAVSTNGTLGMVVQIGDSGGIETSGYNSESSTLTSVAVATSGSTSGFFIRTTNAAANVSGTMTLYRADPSTNRWASTHLFRSDINTIVTGAGDKQLSSTLDRVSITTGNTFDAGFITLFWE